MEDKELQPFGVSLDRLCDGITRRDLLKVGAISFLSLTLPEFLALRADAETRGDAKTGGKKGKQTTEVSVILLWMAGGPSHIDTFDPKPGADVSIKGPFDVTETNVGGVYLSEHLPKLSREMEKMAILRSVTHGEGAHERAQHYLQTGYPPLPTMEFPSYGAIIGKTKGMRNNLPPYITLLGTSEGMSAGFLGGSYNPFFVGNPGDKNYRVADLPLPNGVIPARRERRRFLTAIDSRKGAKSDSVNGREPFVDSAYGLMLRKDSQQAFELNRESETLRDEYGRTGFGQSCLLARRLIEGGARFVTVTMDGWDTHDNNFAQLKNNLLPDLDRGFSALLRDLDSRGMLATTLVVWMGEFGRTPQINTNANPGRDHWPNAMSVVMAGGGVKGGQVVGKTDARAMEPAERPIHVEDVAATLYHAVGLDPDQEYLTPSGCPVKLANNGSIVRELF